MSSVRELNERVQTIVADARPYMSRINVQYASQDLLEADSAMVDYFDGEYSPEKLEDYKKIVCTNYLRLEYILAEFLKQYETSYLKRNRIKVANDKLLTIAKDKNVPVEKRAEALNLSHHVTSAYLKISDIIILLEDDVLEKSEQIIKEYEDSCLM